MAETLKRIAELLTDGDGPTLSDLLTQENRLTDADRQNLRTIVRWALVEAEAVEPSPVNFLRFHAQNLIAQYGTTRKAGEALGIDHAYLYRIAAGEKEWPSDDMLLRMGLERVVTYRPYGRADGVDVPDAVAERLTVILDATAGAAAVDPLAQQEHATEIATAFADLPDQLRAHPGVKRLYRAAVQAMAAGAALPQPMGVQPQEWCDREGGCFCKFRNVACSNYSAPSGVGSTPNQRHGEAMNKPLGNVKPDNDTQVFFYEQDFYVLSNFSAFSVQWGGHRYPTSEHLYHVEKFRNYRADIADLIAFAPSAHEAFKLAERHKADRRPDWDQIKVAVMREILRAKVEQHDYVRRKLLATGDRTLIEDSWRDDFWGWGPSCTGQNMLGKLWMEVRAELRAAGVGGTDHQTFCPEGTDGGAKG